ncbi:MAG: Fe-S cluster assembly protein SufD [Armatimonadetes bacterium]|nr:Fe-S cluster assembly protein SufD [Armatimonadota bacterium]
MMDTIAQIQSDLAGITFDPSAWPSLRESRERAFQSHKTLGIPTLKDEEWKYTNLREIREDSYKIGQYVALQRDEVSSYLLEDLDPIRLVFVNGHFHLELSSSPSVPGLTFSTLANGVPSELGLLQKIEENTFAALNHATFADGAVVRIAKNTKIERPIMVLNMAVADVDRTVYCAPRTMIIAETGAEATIIESYASVGSRTTFTNAATEIFAGPNTRLEVVKIQGEGLQARHIANVEIKQQADSYLDHFNIAFGGAFTRNDINAFLDGSNISSRIDGVVVVGAEQHCDNHTRLDHAFPNCNSFEVYKHVLSGRSTTVFNGKIYVHQDAQKTDAKQTNQAILLSPEATMNSKPQLEIFADDVKCTHGATVGQLDSMPQFYLQSRGIPKDEAESLLIYAFAAEVLEKISHPGLRDLLEAKLFAKLAADREA